MLAALVVVGVGLIVAAIHFTGGSRGASIASEEQVRARFAADYPNVQISGVVVTADRRSALLETADGRTGLVHAVGAKFLTRLLGPRDVAVVRPEGDTVLTVRFWDFTFPSARFVFSSPAETARAEALLTGQGNGRRAA